MITGIGRPGAVKPIELKTSVSMSSTPNRTASTASTPLSVVTPGGKSDDSSDSKSSTAEDKLSKSARGTPHRGGGGGAAKNGPSPPITSAPSDQEHATSNSNSTSAPTSKPPGSSTSSTSAPSPTVSEKAAFDRKMSPQTQRTPPPPSARTPPVKERSASSTPSSVSSGTTAAPAGIVTAAAVAATVGAGTPTAVGTSAGLGGGAGVGASGSGLASLLGSGLLPPLGKTPEMEEPVLTEEQRQIMRMIDESFHFVPDSVDSEKANRYVPRNLYPTPAAFPTTPLPVFENGAVFEKLDVDTLFFIFYYQQGSYQQYLAARELKRRTWGYHKKYKTWFKRHEEPQVTGEDYEQGTFVYFDYETGWCQRIKTEFTFEYSYLEDELL